MKEVAYYELLKGVADRMGWDADNLDSPEWHSAKRAISKALNEAWTEVDWPPLRRVEWRRFHADWDATEAVSAGTFRFYPPTGAYYQALQDSTGEEPADYDGSGWETNLQYWAEAATTVSGNTWVATRDYVQGDTVYYPADYTIYQCHTDSSAGTLPTDTGFWGAVSAMDPVIPWTRSGLTPIGTVLGLFDADPDTFRGARQLAWVESVNGIQFQGPASTETWIRYQLRPPRFTGDTWDSGAAYTAVDDEDAVTVTPSTAGAAALIAVQGRTALRARTAHAANEVVYLSFLVSAGDGQGGMFEFEAAESTADDGVDYLKPDDVDGGDPGRWVRSVNP